MQRVTVETLTGFAEVNGAKIHYEICGDGMPLIMLHAGIADSRMWDVQFDFFSRYFRVIRYDARGYGRTEVVEGGYSQHDDLYGLMRFLGIERAFLMGCSMGGGAILDFALAHPGMVGALIPVCSSVSGSYAQSTPPEVRDAIGQAYMHGDLDACAEILIRVWVDGPLRAPEDVSAEIRDKVREMMLIFLQTPDGVGVEKPANPPAINRLGEIRAPSLVVYGDLDQPNILTVAGLLTSRIAGARKAVITGTAHVPNMEKPKEFNQIVLDFLSDL